MKILITGSSGYVGRVLSRHFIENGIAVTGIDTDYDGYLWQNPLFEFRPGSVTDMSFLKKVFTETAPTHVIHLAWLMNPLHDRLKEYSIDVTGSMHVLVCANQTRSVRQLVFLSSASAYGASAENPMWISEEAPLFPGDYRYGIYKKKVEECYGRFNRRNGLHIVIMRMCTAIGPSYHKRGGVLRLLAKSRVLPRFDGRFCELQFIHEDDLSRIMELVVRDGKISGTYNLAPDSYSRIDELAPGRIYLAVPLYVARAAVRILWHLRISSAMPGAMNLAAYGIVIDPYKIMKRYDYKFRYSTHKAYIDTVNRRMLNRTL